MSFIVKYAVFTSNGSWTVPADWNSSNNIIACIGAGGNGAAVADGAGSGGGGGGAYSATENVSLTPGATVYVTIGGGGGGGTAGSTWVNWSTNAAPTLVTNGVLARGGGNGTGVTGGIGGTTTDSIGNTKFAGGTGGGGNNTGDTGGGGGGAAGPGGAGKAGGTGGTGASDGGGGGGGAGGGSSTAGSGTTTSTGGAGGDGPAGTGGGAGGTGTDTGTAGTAGTGAGGGGGGGTAGTGGSGGSGSDLGTISGTAYGAGGGGGGNGDNNSAAGQPGGGNGGLYGGGGGGRETGGSGGLGADGVVVISYIVDVDKLYWINGTGTWSDTNQTNWSLTSGGSASEAIPDSTCDVFFDANSDAGSNFTVTVGPGAACRNLTASDLDKVMSFVESIDVDPLDVYGSYTIPTSNITYDYSGLLTFRSTSSGRTINVSNTLGDVTFNGSGGEWTLLNNITTNLVTTTTLTTGTVNLNSYVLTTPVFSSNGTTQRSLDFTNGGTIILTGGEDTVIWLCNTATNFSISGYANVISTYSGSTGSRFIRHASTGSTTEENSIGLTIPAGSDIANVQGWFRDLTFDNTISKFSGTLGSGGSIRFYGNLMISDSMTVSSAGPFFTSLPRTNNTINIANTQTVLRSLSIGSSSIAPATTVANTILISNVSCGYVAIDGANVGLKLSNNKLVSEFFYIDSNVGNKIIDLGSGVLQLTANYRSFSLDPPLSLANLTFIANTSTIYLSNTSNSNTYFNTYGYNFYNLRIAGGNDSNTIIQSIGNTTFNNIISDSTSTHNVYFYPGLGTSYSVNNFHIRGSSGNVVSISSDPRTLPLIAKIENPNANTADKNDLFGYTNPSSGQISTSSISNQYILIGAPYEDESGGNANSGVAYIFSTSNGNLLHTLVNSNANDTPAGDLFGYATSISDSYAAVSALLEGDANGSSSGAVYVFHPANAALAYTLTNPNESGGSSTGDRFGEVVKITDNYIIVTAPQEDVGGGGTNAGKIYVYHVSNGTFIRSMTSPSVTQRILYGTVLAACDQYMLASSIVLNTGARSFHLYHTANGALITTIDPYPDSSSSMGEDPGGIAISNNYILIGDGNYQRSTFAQAGRVSVYYSANGVPVSNITHPLVSDSTFSSLTNAADFFARFGNRVDITNNDLFIIGSPDQYLPLRVGSSFNLGRFDRGAFYVIDANNNLLHVVDAPETALSSNNNIADYILFSSGLAASNNYILSTSIVWDLLDGGARFVEPRAYLYSLKNEDKQHNLIKLGSDIVGVEYANISYSSVSPNTVWYADIETSSNNGNNNGWIFASLPLSAGNFLLFF